MLIQEILMKPRELKQELESLVMKCEALKASAERTVAIISLAPGHGQGVSRRLEDIEIEKVDLEKRIEKKKEEFLDAQAEARRLIWKLEDPSDIKMLELRYVDVLTWEKVAEELNYCIQHAMKKGNAALKELNMLP